MNGKKFPVIGTGECIDWNLIEPHRDQAKHNHRQSLEQLADRGGLFWNELLWVLLDKGLWGIKLDSDEDYEKACRRALAHEELKQYREIGTLEECQKSVEICKAVIERKITPENMEEYMKFEDECVKCGFTFGSLLEAREKQIPYKPSQQKLVWGIGRCKCGVEFLDRKTNYCGNCGQKLNWNEDTVTEMEDMEARR